MNFNKWYLGLCIIGILILGYFKYYQLEQYYEGLERQSALYKSNAETVTYDWQKKTSNSMGSNQDNLDNDSEQPSIKLNARYALLLDADNNRVLYEKNGNDEVAMASTTKIMTLIIALERGNPDDLVTFSQNAAGMPDVQLNAKSGETFRLEDLLYSLMLESHNDTAVAIAEHIGGSVKGFAALMNQKAKDLGLNHTNFVTPNGLDAPGHHTTAHDLAIIASYATKKKDFRAITNAANHTFKNTKNKSYMVSNKNRFLYMMDGAFGVKTGFTSKAGYCFVGALKQDNKTFISVVLASGWPPHKQYKWNDTKQLMNYGLTEYGLVDIFDGSKTFYEVPVIDGQLPHISLSIEGSIPLLMSKHDTVTIEYEVPEQVMAPVTKGDIIGYARYYINGNLYQSIPILSKDTVLKEDYKYNLNKIINLWLGLDK